MVVINEHKNGVHVIVDMQIINNNNYSFLFNVIITKNTNIFDSLYSFNDFNILMEFTFKYKYAVKLEIITWVGTYVLWICSFWFFYYYIKHKAIVQINKNNK